MKRIFYLTWLMTFLIGIFFTSNAFAKAEIIEVDGYYTMGDGDEENQKIAKERAQADAKRRASEQASIFIETLTEVKNGILTRDEIKTISSIVMKIKSSEVFPEIDGKSITYRCHMVAVVDPENVLAQIKSQDREELLKATNRIKELEAENERIIAENQRIKSEYANASEIQKKQLNLEMKQNEIGFTVNQLNEKAVELLNKGEYQQAQKYLLEALAIDNKNLISLSNLGLAYLSLQKNDEGIECFKKIIEIDPKNANAYEYLGFIYQVLENYDKAVEYYIKAFENESKTAYSLKKVAKNIGSVAYDYYLHGDRDKSIECHGKSVEYYKEALKLEPKNSEILYSIGNELSEIAYRYDNRSTYNKSMDYYNQSIATYERALKFDSKNPKILGRIAFNLLNIAEIYKGYLKNYEKAVAYYNQSIGYYDKVLKLDPSNNNYKYWKNRAISEMNKMKI